MRAMLKFLLTLLLIIVAIVCVIIVKVEPTMSDAELLMMIQAASDTQKTDNSITTNIINELPNKFESTIVENTTTNKTPDPDNKTSKETQKTEKIEEVEELKNITTDIIVCQHKNVSVSTINATCTKNGKKTTICNDCGKKTNETATPKLSHKTTTITTEATCKNNGEIKTVCSVCNTVLSTKLTAKGCHTNLTLLEEIEPTPFEDGRRVHKCGYCKEEITVILKFWQNGDVNLCIPAIGVNCEINLGECNQSNTDKYDVTCDMNFIDNNNPLFFGHSTRTLGKLHKLKVGDLIYFTIDGKTSVYKVTISEEGFLINGGIDIQGKETGTSCIAPCKTNTLHFFTCYSTIFNYNSRWIVLAEKIE